MITLHERAQKVIVTAAGSLLHRELIQEMDAALTASEEESRRWKNIAVPCTQQWNEQRQEVSALREALRLADLMGSYPEMRHLSHTPNHPCSWCSSSIAYRAARAALGKEKGADPETKECWGCWTTASDGTPVDGCPAHFPDRTSDDRG